MNAFAHPLRAQQQLQLLRRGLHVRQCDTVTLLLQVAVGRKDRCLLAQGLQRVGGDPLLLACLIGGEQTMGPGRPRHAATAPGSVSARPRSAAEGSVARPGARRAWPRSARARAVAVAELGPLG